MDADHLARSHVDLIAHVAALALIQRHVLLLAFLRDGLDAAEVLQLGERVAGCLLPEGNPACDHVARHVRSIFSTLADELTLQRTDRH